eukprot:c28983_g1_i3 orf=466-2397(-)
MGKQGPCWHCGISTTPLWRNGPPEKPVLCNACGSRWRTKGSLVNYMPMHSGGCGVKNDLADKSLGKKGSQRLKEQQLHKRKEPDVTLTDFEYGFMGTDFLTFKGFDEDASTWSSTGSGISYSEGCVQCNAGAGKKISVSGLVWDFPIPSRKRTPLCRHHPSVEKLARLQMLLYKTEIPALKYPLEQDLLVDYKSPLMAVEIGLGGVFIRPQVPVVQEQESASNSLIFENIGYDQSDAFRHNSSGFEKPSEQFSSGTNKPLFVQGKEKARPGLRIMEAKHSDKSCMINYALLDNFPYNNRDILQSCRSTLAFLELKDIVNFDVFMGLLTEQEQCQFMEYVSSADVSSIPDSLKEMFSSSQFESALVNFQALLSEGMFDSLESGLSPCAFQLYQQLLTVTDLVASGWKEQWSQYDNHAQHSGCPDLSKALPGNGFQREKRKGRGISGMGLQSTTPVKRLPGRPFGQIMTGRGENARVGPAGFISSSSMLSGDWQSRKFASSAGGCMSKNSVGIEAVGKSGSGSCISSDSFLLSTLDKCSSGQSDSIDVLADEVAEPDLLLDVPSTMSFQQAELLPLPGTNKPLPVNDLSTADHEPKPTDSLIVTNTWYVEDNLDWGKLFWNNPLSTGSGHVLPNGSVINPGKTFL